MIKLRLVNHNKVKVFYSAPNSCGLETSAWCCVLSRFDQHMT